MDAIAYCLSEIGHSIPAAILHEAFVMTEDPELAHVVSLETRVLTRVIRARVMIDTNIFGGVEDVIALDQMHAKFKDNRYSIYTVPPELVSNREIVSVLGLVQLNRIAAVNDGIGGYGSEYGGMLSGGSNSALIGAAARVGFAAQPRAVMMDSHTELVGRNLILVGAGYRRLYAAAVRVVLTNDANYSNIQPRSYKVLANLCVLATKAYIYNKLIVALNSGQLSGGQELGIIKSIIEEYQSANEDYNTFLKEKWAKVAFMNDTNRYHRHLKSKVAIDI